MSDHAYIPKEDGPTYWEIRKALLDALRDNDNDMVVALSEEYPEVFNNVANQAKNAMRKKR